MFHKRKIECAQHKRHQAPSDLTLCSIVCACACCVCVSSLPLSHAHTHSLSHSPRSPCHSLWPSVLSSLITFCTVSNLCLAPAQMFGGQVLQTLYGGSPNVSFFKGDGEPQLGSILDMPDNSSSGGYVVLHIFPTSLEHISLQYPHARINRALPELMVIVQKIQAQLTCSSAVDVKGTQQCDGLKELCEKILPRNVHSDRWQHNGRSYSATDTGAFWGVQRSRRVLTLPFN